MGNVGMISILIPFLPITFLFRSRWRQRRQNGDVCGRKRREEKEKKEKEKKKKEKEEKRMRSTTHYQQGNEAFRETVRAKFE